MKINKDGTINRKQSGFTAAAKAVKSGIKSRAEIMRAAFKADRSLSTSQEKQIADYALQLHG